MKRAKALNKDLETSILERLHPRDDQQDEPVETDETVGYRSKDRA